MVGRLRLQVEIVTRSADLAGWVDDWDELASNAEEPNVFYESWMLLPAIEKFAGNARLLFAFVYASDLDKPLDEPILCGFFPFEDHHSYRKLPLRVLRSWRHLHCFLATPLIRKGLVKECFEALLAWARAEGVAFLDFVEVHGKGAFEDGLREAASSNAVSVFARLRSERAILERAADGEQYLATSMSPGSRKELRRQRKRLSESGHLELRVLAPDGDVDAWIENFLEVEACGWKGQEHTALAAHVEERDYFTAIAHGAHARGKLMMLGLFLDDRPIALKCNFLAPPGAYAFKIAYDESLAKYSPGVQLELDNVLEFHARANLEWMDSCAKAQHFMINRLWKDRRTIQSIGVSTGNVFGNAILSGWPLARRCRQLLMRIKSNVPSPVPIAVEAGNRAPTHNGPAKAPANATLVPSPPSSGARGARNAEFEKTNANESKRENTTCVP